jgi:hypothetical protein
MVPAAACADKETLCASWADRGICSWERRAPRKPTSHGPTRPDVRSCERRVPLRGTVETLHGIRGAVSCSVIRCAVLAAPLLVAWLVQDLVLHAFCRRYSSYMARFCAKSCSLCPHADGVTSVAPSAAKVALARSVRHLRLHACSWAEAGLRHSYTWLQHMVTVQGCNPDITLQCTQAVQCGAPLCTMLQQHSLRCVATCCNPALHSATAPPHCNAALHVATAPARCNAARHAATIPARCNAAQGCANLESDALCEYWGGFEYCTAKFSAFMSMCAAASLLNASLAHSHRRCEV